jgi:hypothetical protein
VIDLFAGYGNEENNETVQRLSLKDWSMQQMLVRQKN